MSRGPFNTTFDIYNPNGVWNAPAPTLVQHGALGRLVLADDISWTGSGPYPITAWATFGVGMPLTLATKTKQVNGIWTFSFLSNYYLAHPSGAAPNWAVVELYTVSSALIPAYYRYTLTPLPLPF